MIKNDSAESRRVFHPDRIKIRGSGLLMQYNALGERSENESGLSRPYNGLNERSERSERCMGGGWVNMLNILGSFQFFLYKEKEDVQRPLTSSFIPPYYIQRSYVHFVHPWHYTGVYGQTTFTFYSPKRSPKYSQKETILM